MLTRCRVVSGLAAAAVTLAGCGGGAGAPSGTSTSPVTHEPRDAGTGGSLQALLVSPAEPAIPFKGSNGKVITSYELRLFNATPLTLVPARASISTPEGTRIEKLRRR